MKNILRLTLLLLLVTGGVLAKVEITNRTESPIKVEISYIGVGSPYRSPEINPMGHDTCKRDLANIKTGYDVWVKKGNDFSKVLSVHGIRDLGAFRNLDLLQYTNPEDGEILYSLNRSGY